MPTTPTARFYRWNDMPKERVTDQLERRMVTGEKSMLAQILLKRGAIVPRHSHHNEQIAYVLEGALRLWLGPNDEERFDLRPGEVLLIPSNLPHRAEALEDTLEVDVFCPPRQDWLDGTDTYFHQK